MRIALDAQLRLGTATGIGEYVDGLAKALRSNGADVVELQDPALDPWRFDRRVYWDQLRLPQLAREAGADVLHCASGTAPMRLSMPLVVTVHDVAWLRVQGHARAYARYYFGPFALARYRRARRIVVDSNFSRGELLEVLAADPKRIETVYPGVSADFAQVRRASDGRTILAVGTLERRKNLELIVRALARLPDARVVSVGPHTPYADECRALAAELGVSDRWELRGYVSREELLELYARSAVAAVPSRYEGFGYGAAQALCAGVPLVAASTSSLVEVVANDAPLLLPDDVDAWVAALRDALDGRLDDRAEAVRASAIERFGWNGCARRMLAVYSAALR